MKNNIFLDVNDGTSAHSLQLVLKKNIKPDNLTFGCSISAEGDLGLAPNGRSELNVKEITILGECKLEGYPFYPRKQYLKEYVRQYLHFRPRTRTFSSTIRLRDLAMNSIRDHFRNHNFINIDTPILTSNDCEGAGEVFHVQANSEETLERMKKEEINDELIYFNKKTYLSVSGQLQLEACAR
jgi:asparaginyl-tRNA synthetase